MCDIDTQSTILEPLTFSLQAICNISQPTEAFPNVDVHLQLNHVKVFTYSMCLTVNNISMLAQMLINWKVLMK